MKSTYTPTNNLLIFGIPLLLFVMAVLLTQQVALNNTLSLALSIDLLLVIPLVYLFLIRKSRIPKTTSIPVVLIGLFIGYKTIPEAQQQYLDMFTHYVLPLIELSVVGFIIYKVTKAIRAYKRLKTSAPDFYDVLKNVCGEIVPKRLALALATEVGVLYYGFLHFKKLKLAPNEFSHHKTSGAPALYAGIILVIAIETVALHFLLMKWNVVTAWIVTVLSVYTAIQFFGYARALSQRPISIDPNGLTLRYSIMNETYITFDQIDRLELNSQELEKDKLTKSLSALGTLESHNCVLYLKSEHQLTGVYGIKKSYRILSFYIDQPTNFKVQLDAAMQS